MSENLSQREIALAQLHREFANRELKAIAFLSSVMTHTGTTRALRDFLDADDEEANGDVITEAFDVVLRHLTELNHQMKESGS